MPALAVQMTLSGEASTFDAAAQGSFKTQLAAMLDGVRPSDITLAIVPARLRRRLQTSSFDIDIHIRMPSTSSSEAAADVLRRSSVTDLSNTLGVTINSIGAPTVSAALVGAPSPPPPLSPSPSVAGLPSTFPPPLSPINDTSERQSMRANANVDAASLGGGIGGAIGLLFVILCSALVLWRRRSRKMARYPVNPPMSTPNSKIPSPSRLEHADPDRFSKLGSYRASHSLSDVSPCNVEREQCCTSTPDSSAMGAGRRLRLLAKTRIFTMRLQSQKYPPAEPTESTTQVSDPSARSASTEMIEVSIPGTPESASAPAPIRLSPSAIAAGSPSAMSPTRYRTAHGVTSRMGM